MERGFYHFGMGFGPFGWIGAIIGVLITIAIVVALVWLVVWAIRSISGRQNHHMVQQNLPAAGTGAQTAKEIAQTRYAKGEINREEYQQILADLNQ